MKAPCGLRESQDHTLEARTVSRTDTNRAISTDLLLHQPGIYASGRFGSVQMSTGHLGSSGVEIL